MVWGVSPCLHSPNMPKDISALAQLTNGNVTDRRSGLGALDGLEVRLAEPSLLFRDRQLTPMTTEAAGRVLGVAQVDGQLQVNRRQILCAGFLDACNYTKTQM